MLSPAEKAAGRHFKTECLELLRILMDGDPPTHRALPLLGVFRHSCPRRGTSTPIALKEIYRPSPAYGVHVTGEPVVLWNPDEPHFLMKLVPAGRFGFLYKEGRCAYCRATVRTEGRLVDGWQRPPLRRRD